MLNEMRQLCNKNEHNIHMFAFTFNNFANVFQEINISYFVSYIFKSFARISKPCYFQMFFTLNSRIFTFLSSILNFTLQYK